MANVVQVLADGRLERARPHGRGYRFAAASDCRVQGVLVDMRYLPREKVAVLGVGDVLDISPDDIESALSGVRPIEVHRAAGRQVVRALVDRSTGVTDALAPEATVRVQDPGILLGEPNETFDQWMDRAYSVHVGTRRDYERDLVLRVASAGHVLARRARPCGWSTVAHWLIRAQSYESLG